MPDRTPQRAPLPAATASGEWRQRPWLSRALRVSVVAVPVGMSYLAAMLLNRLLPRAHDAATAALWITIVAGASLAVLVGVERLMRRLLPLAALLNLSLLFPEKAPKRFAIARRTGSPSDLRAKVEAAHASHHFDEAQRLQTVVELVLALSVHDKASRGHSERVRVFADLIADELKLSKQDRGRLHWAALLHDIGKLEVPPSVLNKPAQPTPEEWAIIHRHPEEGARIIAPLLPWLGEWGKAVVEHHERYDGKGYPHGLKGTEISLGARVVAVADTWEVMTAPRAYRRPMSVAAARRELVRVAGKQLDPVIVRAFLNISNDKLWRRLGVWGWLGQIPTLGRVLSGLGSWAGTGAAALAATGVIAISGVADPPVLFHDGAGVMPPAPAALVGTGPVIARGTAPAAPVSTTPTSTPTTAPTSAPAPGASATAQPAPTATAKPAPTATATPTTPTPATIVGSWDCSACTNTSASCTSYCSKSQSCTAYCVNKTSNCTVSCFGNGGNASSNPSCVQYCQGKNNPMCQSNCRAGPAAWWAPPPTTRFA